MLTNRRSLLRVIGRTVTRVRFAGEADILPNAFSSLVLHERSLWIASSGGTARLELAALHASADGRGPLPRARRYDAADGLLNGHTAYTAVNTAAVAKDGRLWFATAGGLAVYDSRFDVPNSTPPLVRIEEILANGKRVPAGSSSIPPRPDRVQIHYTAISMRAPAKVRLEYMLEGADHDWVRATPDRVATYTQLRAGNYRFRVRAWNEDGVPSAAESELALRVVPTWYESNLFRVPAILVAIALGPFVVFYILRRRARLREAELHARFDAALVERTRIARELHDTLLQGFGGITLQLHTVSHTLASVST
jgi:signal transduction histidine kinase